MVAGIIYLIRNTVNGKVYVGQTQQSLAQRKSEHLSRHERGERDHKLYLAMKKHGAENFYFEEFCSAVSQEHLDALEVQVIAQFNSYNRGYNSNPGGNGVSEETKVKLSKIFKGRKAPWSVKVIQAFNEKNRGNEIASLGAYAAAGSENPKARGYVVRRPSGHCETVYGLKKYCRDNGLTHKCVLQTFDGNQFHHKGFTLMAKLDQRLAA